MFWYIIDTNFSSNKKMFDLLNKQENIRAFIPKVEKWFKSHDLQEYQLRDMYPGYIFVETSFNEKEFKEKYLDLLKSVERLGKVLEKDEFIALNSDERKMLSDLLDNSNSIRHSRGKYNGDELEIFKGPLKGFEKDIKKINRHKRIAKVNFSILGKEMLLPLEVINKKGSVINGTR